MFDAELGGDLLIIGLWQFPENLPPELAALEPDTSLFLVGDRA